jgi:hypothetical protein
MILVFSITTVALGTLCVSLAVLVIIIAYRKLLRYLGKGHPPKEDYAVLYSIEMQPAMGVIDLYYELKVDKEIEIHLLDINMKDFMMIDKRMATKGGNKVLFDTTKVLSGNYYFELRSDNQKTMKKIRVENPA